MKRYKSTLWMGCLVVASSFLLQIGCSSSDNPSDPNPGDNLSVNENAEALSNTTVSVYENISSIGQIASFMAGGDDLVDLDIPELEDRTVAKRFAETVKAKSLRAFKRSPELLTLAQTTQEDSIVFDVTERDSVEGVTRRISLIYNRTTGAARFFVVGFDYSDPSPLEYDSTEVAADLNGTLFNEDDDVLTSLQSLRRFKPGQLIREESGSFTPDAHTPGSEPEGGILTNRITYSSTSFISQSNATFEYHENSGGSFSKTSEFSDGTTHRESATFTTDGTGSFEEDRRDGSQVRGTFDSAENDGQGSFSLTTTFPANHDPKVVAESGTFAWNSADSTINGTFERVVTRLDDTTESESVTVSQSRVDDLLTTTLEVDGADGNGRLTVTETPDLEQIAGEWNNPDGTFVKFTAQSFPDGSAHIEGEEYASAAAFQNGDEPTTTGVFDLYPDGSGQGVVTEGDDVYDVIIRPDGTVEVTKRT